MHQAPWIPRAIYSLKISLLSDQFKITSKDKAALLEVCLFIVTSYVGSNKAYEKIDKSIAKAALQKISQTLWYLTDEVLSCHFVFDDEVDQENKVQW
ncbi:hypothetical protein J437_LFUL003589 [Ladona fulva]|uniref:Uncharacterized protein n=1 Tax=Ladona fulva TaxID=123851 RepID=A0A8K0JVM1_LADFU|nr:hypothetical protein J437_LFUL003589 [Ladona fulva]